MWHKLKKRKWKTPVLNVWFRMILYAAAIFFAVLSFCQIETGWFSKELEFIIYLCAAGTTFPACLYIVPDIRRWRKAAVEFIQRLSKKYQVVNEFLKDYRFRTFSVVSAGMVINIAFAVFNGMIGVISSSPWYVTLAVYYLSLSIMRVWIVCYERKSMGKKISRPSIEKEIRIYKVCSINMIFLTAVLGGMVILTIHSFGERHYPGMTIYIAALYTFIKVPMAVGNLIKTTKMRTPLLVTIRSIGYADACVSVLSLQTAMFSSFGTMEIKENQMLMNGITGTGVCLMVLGIGIYGVYKAHRMKMQNSQKE